MVDANKTVQTFTHPANKILDLNDQERYTASKDAFFTD